MSVLTLSTYTVHVPARQVSLRQRFDAFRSAQRTRAEVRSVLSGDLGPAQRAELLAVTSRGGRSAR